MKYLGKITNDKDLVTKEYVDEAVSAKQDALTFDTEPTSGSANPVTSGGIYSAMQHVQGVIEVVRLI